MELLVLGAGLMASNKMAMTTTTTMMTSATTMMTTTTVTTTTMTTTTTTTTTTATTMTTTTTTTMTRTIMMTTTKRRRRRKLWKWRRRRHRRWQRQWHRQRGLEPIILPLRNFTPKIEFLLCLRLSQELRKKIGWYEPRKIQFQQPRWLWQCTTTVTRILAKWQVLEVGQPFLAT